MKILRHSRVPDFLGIGAMKCGTTSLHDYLIQHPELTLPRIKETDFFYKRDRYEKGLDWYRLHFRGAGRICGEVSPNYTKSHIDPRMAKRIHSHLSNAKLIFLVRNPVDRILSHHAHSCGMGRERRALDDMIDGLQESNYLQTTRYFYQLQFYLKYFEREQILLICAEDLRNEPHRTMETVLRFIGADDCRPKYRRVPSRTKNAHDYYVKPIFLRLANSRLSTFLHQRFPSLLFSNQKVPRIPPSQEFRRRVLELLAEDRAQLEDWSGRKFSHWDQLTDI